MKIKALYIFLLLSCLLFSFIVFAQKNNNSISFEQLQDSMQLNSKSIIIKIYTDWCSYCKMQDKQISKDSTLQRLLQEKYYFIELNAETKKEIIFNGKKYKFISNGLSGGIHELAFLLGNTNGELSYPSWVILNDSYQIMHRFRGLLKNKELRQIITEGSIQ